MRSGELFFGGAALGKGEEGLAFIEFLLRGGHFAQISSLNAAVENQGSGVRKVWS